MVRQLETILGKCLWKTGEPKQPAVVAASCGPSVEKRLETLSKQMSQLQRQQQQVVNAYPLNAFGNSVGQPRSNGQAQAKPCVDQSPQLRDLQRQVARLESDYGSIRIRGAPTSDHMGEIFEVSREIQFAVSARG